MMNDATDSIHHQPAPTSLQVIESIAAQAGTDAAALEPPLYSVVDPEALNALARAGSHVEISFEYQGHSVHVSGTKIIVDGQHYDKEHRSDGDR